MVFLQALLYHPVHEAIAVLGRTELGLMEKLSICVDAVHYPDHSNIVLVELHVIGQPASNIRD